MEKPEETMAISLETEVERDAVCDLVSSDTRLMDRKWVSGLDAADRPRAHQLYVSIRPLPKPLSEVRFSSVRHRRCRSRRLLIDRRVAPGRGVDVGVC